MNQLDIEYNTEKETIRFPEYGRSIQEMILYAKTIEDDYRRQKTVEAIVAMMMIVNPSGNRNMDDYREKLWNHAFAIANHELNVNAPVGVTIRREDEFPVVRAVEYPASATRYRHYGNGIQALIQKAIEMPDGSKKEGFVEVIASYMKLAYKTWNKEHYVSDDIVKEDLEILSDGQLSLHEGHDSLDKLAAHAGKHDKDRNQRNQRRKGTGSGGGNNRGRSNTGTGGGNKRTYGGGGSSGGNTGNYRNKRKK